MTKGGRAVEPRTRIMPLDKGVPELRVREDGTSDLGWALVLKDGHEIGQPDALLLSGRSGDVRPLA